MDGDLLERWFIKTCINLALVQQGAVSWFGGKPGRVPPAGIIAAAFGRERLPRGAGLYAAASVGEQGFGSESVHFAPLFDSEDRMPGAIFKFYGFRFLLSFRPGMLPARVSIGDDRESPWHATELLYHIERARFTIGNELSHWVYFEWPEKLSAHYRE